jgi:hypothetical protein
MGWGSSTADRAAAMAGGMMLSQDANVGRFRRPILVKWRNGSNFREAGEEYETFVWDASAQS